jgi:hypothetical protein
MFRIAQEMFTNDRSRSYARLMGHDERDGQATGRGTEAIFAVRRSINNVIEPGAMTDSGPIGIDDGPLEQSMPTRDNDRALDRSHTKSRTSG